MTTPYENGYQLGLEHNERRADWGVGARDLTPAQLAELERTYHEAKNRLAVAHNANESAVKAFQDGYMRGRYGMAARKVGGGYTPW